MLILFWSTLTPTTIWKLSAVFVSTAAKNLSVYDANNLSFAKLTLRNFYDDTPASGLDAVFRDSVFAVNHHPDAFGREKYE
jgi:hypothetical protein